MSERKERKNPQNSVNRHQMRTIIMTVLYQYRLFGGDCDLEELMYNAFAYDLAQRFAHEEERTAPVSAAVKRKLTGKEESPQVDLLEIQPFDHRYADREDLSYMASVICNAVNKEDEFVRTLSARLVNWSFDRLGFVEQAILLTGISEMDVGSVDYKVILDEAVRLAKEYCEEEAFSMINGVLDMRR